MKKETNLEMVYDRETKVQYAISIGNYNQEIFSLLVDANRNLYYIGRNRYAKTKRNKS